MGTQRFEAFTDGVMAIIITIMVLEIKVPSGATTTALLSSLPIILTYTLSFVNVGIFWNNHHHVLHAASRVDGNVLWANLFLLFWMSLVPFVIRWIDEAGFQALPTAAYGAVLAMASIGYLLLEWALVSCNGPSSTLATAVGYDLKSIISLALYASAILLAFWRPWIAILLYIAVAVAWFLPDRRIESLKET
jgi:uncharacterized membrane protein